MTHTVRSRRAPALALAAALVGSVVVVGPAAAGPSATLHPGRPPAVSTSSVPVRPVAAEPVAGRPATGAAAPLPAPAWPAAGSALADTAHLATAPDGRSAARAGRLPVWLGADTSGQVGVRVADRATTAAAGVDGVLVGLWRAGAGTDGGPVPVSVDYSAFRTAHGADWAARLRLVELPACALTTPKLAECQTQGTLPTSRNDYRHALVSASVDLPAAPAGAKAATASGAQTASSTQTVALAVTAGSSGPDGTYDATPLKASATWQAGNQTADFSWSYPVAVPSGLGPLAPAISLSYDSGSVDGLTAGGNSEASWVGDGFGYEPGYVERKYKACADDGVTPVTGDLCWGYDNATVMLNGQATELVKDDTTGTWHLRGDDGSRVEHLFNAANGAHGGEYWRIMTTDGTQYYFGLNRPPGWVSGDAVTSSTWTVPVYGPKSTDPCNASPGWCYQAWRWNLDVVIDPHGNAETFWYQPETNHYARGYTGTSAGTPTIYTRGGYLTRISYGERSSDTFASSPMRVLFNVSDRCSSSATICDVPWDLNCASGASCSNNTSPSFWTTKQLNSIVAQVWSTSTAAYASVDTYTLAHELKDTGDGTYPLVLDSITRTGNVGGSASVPRVAFGYVSLANRVDLTSLPAFRRNRISSITSESGSVISVTYSGPGCTASTEPVPDTNATWCFPQWWDGWPASSEPHPDWFTKYEATDVTVHDVTGASPDEVHHYDYQGGGAWHYDDDTGLVPDKDKTWAQWRGFQKVVATTGASGGTQSQSSRLFMRGMNGDRTGSGGTSAVSVKDSQGVSVPDDPGLEGFAREEIISNGPGGAEVSGQVDDVLRTVTATATHSWGTVTATLVSVAVSHGRTDLSGGRGVVQTEVDNTYDGYGVLAQSLDVGDVSNPTTRCTTYSYARNTSAYLLTYPSAVVTTATSCGTSLPSDPHLIISDVRMSYDGQAWGAAPVSGGANPTRVERLSAGGSSPTFVTVSTSAYDEYGRVTSTTDALNRATTTTYTPASGNAVTQVAVKDPAGNTATTTLDPMRGVPVRKVDVNGKSTTLAYDPLGRLTSVWLPGQDPATAKASETHSYTVSSSAASLVTTSILLPNGSAYATSYQLYDGQLRPRQVQSPDETGQGGRVITDTDYDSRGLVAKANASYYDGTTPPGGTLVTAFTDTDVPGQTLSVYDGAGRKTAEIFRAYGVERWRTTTGYGGDRVTVTPPAGGTATTVVTDARGEAVLRCQYEVLPASGNCDASSSSSTTYTYYPNGLLARVADPAGNRWSYDYDTRGRKVSAADPDTGPTTYTYDDADQLTSATDARGQELSYVHDVLGHRAQEWSGAAGSGTELAAWTYNTSGSNLEQLASSTRFAGGSAYTTAITGYDNAYRPTAVTITIPSIEGKLAAAYSLGYSYNVDGTLASETLPAAGGLAAETVNHTYDGVTGLPVKTSGLSGYVQESEFTELAQQRLLALGTSTTSQWTYQQFAYDLPTRRLSEVKVSRDAAPGAFAADTRYGYDPAGDVTSAADTPTSTAATDVQCFQYDALRRLTQAWAQGSAGCATAPSTSVLGGPSPYWEQLAYDVTGNRTSETMTSGGGTVTTTSTYPAPGQPRPHALIGQSVSGPSGTTTNTFGYDLSGDTTARGIAGTSQTLSWGPEGELAKVADTTHGHTTAYVYDADGGLLIRHDDAAATLYLPDEELALDAGGTVTATRYYRHGGVTVAARTPGGVTWLLADPHNTDTMSVDASSQAVTERRFLPFGAVRPPLPGSWPGDRAFVGGAADSTTGFTDLGAREYDPANGRFLSPDPLLDATDPQQMNAYAYANDSPTTNSDPSGRMFVAGGGCVGSIQSCSVRSGGVPPAPPYAPWFVPGPIFGFLLSLMVPPAPPPPPSPPPPPPPARPAQAHPASPMLCGRVGGSWCEPAPRSPSSSPRQGHRSPTAQPLPARFDCPGGSWKAFWSGACPGEIEALMKTGPPPSPWLVLSIFASFFLGPLAEAAAPAVEGAGAAVASAGGAVADVLSTAMDAVSSAVSSAASAVADAASAAADAVVGMAQRTAATRAGQAALRFMMDPNRQLEPTGLAAAGTVYDILRQEHSHGPSLNTHSAYMCAHLGVCP